MINTLTISFPDFKLQEIIDPEQFDANNTDLVEKINELIAKANVMDADGFVTTPRIADGAVGEVKIGDQQVTRIKIKDGAIDLSKIDTASLDTRYAKLTTMTATLQSKTDKTGDHQGTWQGLSPADFDAGSQAIEVGAIRDRVTRLEEDVVYESQLGLTVPSMQDGFVKDEYLPSSLNTFKSGVDANGVYTVVESKRVDGTLYRKSVLSNPDAKGQYQTQTISFHDTFGVMVDEHIWTITYDADGRVVSEVKV